MASTASDSSPPSPGAPASAFLDGHALFLDHQSMSTSSFFPTATTTTAECAPLPPAASASSSAVGRKPPRKRPRASRRPPTTVVTTDTSNFRAMVQEFTGIPAPPPFAPHHLGGPGGVLFGAPHVHDPSSAAAGTARGAPLELLMRPSPLKLPAASPHASGSFAHSLFASSVDANPPAGSSSEPYSGFAPTLSGTVPRYGGGGGGFDAAEDERVLGHGHGFFSSFLHAGDRYHNH